MNETITWSRCLATSSRKKTVFYSIFHFIFTYSIVRRSYYKCARSVYPVSHRIRIPMKACRRNCSQFSFSARYVRRNRNSRNRGRLKSPPSFAGTFSCCKKPLFSTLFKINVFESYSMSFSSWFSCRSASNSISPFSSISKNLQVSKNPCKMSLSLAVSRIA